MFFDLLPESRQHLEPAFQRALVGETVRAYALGFTIGTKTSFWNLAAAALIHDGTTYGVLLVSNDVSEQVEAQQALQNALLALQQAHEAVEQQVDERTRELKTLMTVQQALTSSLKLSEVLQIIVYEARRLTHTDVGAVFLPENGDLVLAALSSQHPLGIDIGYSISLSELDYRDHFSQRPDSTRPRHPPASACGSLAITRAGLHSSWLYRLSLASRSSACCRSATR